MKNIFMTITLFVLMGLYAIAGVKMEFIQYHEGDKSNAETNEIIFTNDKMVLNNNDEDGHTTVVFDANKEKLIMVHHDTKTYMVMDNQTMTNVKKYMDSMKEKMKEQLANLPEAQRKAMEERFGMSGKKFDYSVDKTGDSKTINGWKTSKYNLKLNGELSNEVWAAPFEDFGFTMADFAALKKFANFSTKMMESFPGKKKNSLAAIYQNIKGVPVMTDNKITGEITELKSINKYTPTATDFDIPDSYTEQKMPIPGQNR